MNMEADNILQSIIKIADDLDNVDIKDKDAWILISHELKKTVQNLPEGLPSVKDLLSLCVKGIESVSGNMVSNSLSVVDSVFEALEAVEKYFKNKEDGEQPYIYKAVKELKKNLNMKEGFYMSNDDALSLDDVAALLVQTEPDDQVELKNLGEALKKFSYDESCSALAKETIAMAAQKIEGLPDAEPSARDSIIAAIGELIEKAMNENEDEGLEMSDPEMPGPEMPDTGDDSAPAFKIIDEAEEDEEEPVQEIEEKFDYMPEDADPELIVEFITEGLDLITNAEEALLTLENDPDDEDSVGMVFRAFHTIKGTAAFMDLTLISEMGHHAENLLSRVRDGEIRYTGGYADLALRSLDMLKDLINGVEEALGGTPFKKAPGYDELMRILENPEKAGISEKEDDEDQPRIGDILVAQGKVSREDVESADKPKLGDILVAQGVITREKVEQAEKTKADKPLGAALVKTGAASVKDVGKALRTQRVKIKSAVDTSIRVSTDRLDRLIDMVGELVIAHSMVAQDEIVCGSEDYDFLKKVAHTSKIVRELQDMSMSLRMIPLKSTFQKMVRLVRDLAHKTGKKVTLLTEGEETEIDRNMADAIKDPLVHMIRNAVDHGIETPDVRLDIDKPETGTVNLSAYHSAGSVVVEIRDDGKGIDKEVILEKAWKKGLVSDGSAMSDREIFNLIFEPGFSTAREVTDVSGRGVGMDVVKKNIEAIRGQAEIQSEPGKGSVFQMKLPLTLAIIDGMVAKVGSETYVIPMVSIITSIKPEPKDLSTVINKGEMLVFHGSLVPLFRLTSLFDIQGGEEDLKNSIIVVIEDDGNRAGLVIDELVVRQQVVVKTLGETMKNVVGISGGAIMPNGRVGLILDIGGLVRLANFNQA
ncbi:two-component system, chemotaxis family, sensor kinase CheA [Desulfosarcina sp. BuS5]|uniref:chemotaxis protein CheA n=1 Tax=Desulfosarcina sp. BuS5 TaxID=933262 RepID=UPI0006841898|nr:chemotaxis protein CheA [Desulfosarcina sp. BuS5]WDN90013.1 two-component system, chemotaxis family, sensor kinase CheA [Desulfosarcina sp. BuS5]